MPDTEKSNSTLDYRIELELLKKDLQIISKLFEKFDVTLEKLHQVASDLSRIVNVQEQKLVMQDKINEEVEHILVEQKHDHSKDVKDLETKINKVNDDLTTKIENSEDAILKELSNIREVLGKKIDVIESWRYTIMGGLALAGFLVGEIVNFFK